MTYRHPPSFRARFAFVGLVGLACVLPTFGSADEVKPNSANQDKPKSRLFEFIYQLTVTGLKPGEVGRVWIPVPPTNEDQEASVVSGTLPTTGATVKIGTEEKFGNRILYVEAKADANGEIPVSVTIRVLRREVRANFAVASDDLSEVKKFLQPDAKVPVGGKSMSLLEGKKLPSDQVEIGRVLYDVVNNHMRYSKEGTGWGRGDAEWACDSKFGNCSDFHSLFISMARGENIPAKFEIGFPLPEKRGQGEIPGYHCWAKFKPHGKSWVPVDISEANKNPAMKDYYFGNLTENRVAFSTGRDLTLVPKQDGPPLNFFVYPYVEIEGKPYPAEKVVRKFSYQDVNGESK